MTRLYRTLLEDAETMRIMTVTTRISRRWLERKTKSELASIILANIDRIDLFRENANLRSEIEDAALAEYIDRTQQHCEGCGHYLIDVTAANDLQMESHALEQGDEGALAVCAVCLVADARLPGGAA